MGIDWGLLGPPVDIGGNFRAGVEYGQAKRREAARAGALQAYVEDPTNPEAQSALAHYDEGFAVKLAGQRAEQADRQRIGRIVMNPDLDAARFEALAGGDLELAKQIASMSDEQHKRMGDMYKAAAPLAYQALKLPYEQRKAYIDTVRPELKAAGWTDDLLDNFDPTDANLNATVHSAMTLEQAMGRDKIDYREVGPGARLVPFDSFGRPVTSDNGGATQPSTPTGAGGDLSRFDDPAYSAIEAPLEQELGLPQGLMSRIRVKGERSNADQVSSAGARTVYQITPPTRDLFLKKYGVDAYASPQNAARVAALHLKESIERGEDPVRGYIGGPDKRKWGPQTEAYAERVGPVVSEDAATIRAHAQAAIAAGADPAAVKARAASMGVTL